MRIDRRSRQIIFWAIVFGSFVVILLQSAQLSLTMPTLKLQAPENINIAQQIDFKRHFQELGVTGSILIQDLNDDC